MSISRPWVMKKSAPRIGRRTLAIQKLWRKGGPLPKETSIWRLPYVLIVEPLAAMRSVVRWRLRSLAVAGKTHSSAPESIRKERPEILSKIEMVPCRWPAEAIDGRPCRFPWKKEVPPGCLSWGR